MVQGFAALTYVVIVGHVSSFDAGRMKQVPHLTPGPDAGMSSHSRSKERDSIESLLLSMLGEVSLEAPAEPAYKPPGSLFQEPADPTRGLKTRTASVGAAGDLKATQPAPPMREESLAQTNGTLEAAAESETKPRYGHILPWWASHWVWSPDDSAMKYVNNWGVSQGRLDPPGLLTKGVASSEDMVKAIDVAKGQNVDFDENSVGNEEILRTAEYQSNGYWGWGKNDRGWGLPDHPVWKTPGEPEVPGQTKFYHAQWKDAETHLPSAYEPDFFRDNSEFFGPFRMDYNTRTVWVDDWNIHVFDPDGKEGFGNVAVGPHQYLLKATNSFVSGKENNVRGTAVVALGGEMNIAEGDGTFAGGGEGNSAMGKYTSVAGGYHNVAEGDWTTVDGGDRNVVEGHFGAITGGGFNTVESLFGVVSGGRQNSANEQFATVGGGWGNKGQSPASTIGGGAGEKTKYQYEMQVGRPDAHLLALHEEMNYMGREFEDTQTASPTDADNNADDVTTENTVDNQESSDSTLTEAQNEED